ncbi:hypothetical protein M8542_33885 [Amycolatopsis sp. OK19-0408]|uniref:Uncharacterized protein n=1 Tax=Amycolatopsis iheyensis TaxID=2945988 RepID=A0A9X2NFL2_9PSEU|nr:hypothetical protein [Amycolatopsis iheyensis]MCR6487829.1 hypothetical protein [Amycolatopsis iheyensis]
MRRVPLAALAADEFARSWACLRWSPGYRGGSDSRGLGREFGGFGLDDRYREVAFQTGGEVGGHSWVGVVGQVGRVVGEAGRSS